MGVQWAQRSGGMVDRARRILYDLAVHAEVEARCGGAGPEEADAAGYGARLFAWGPRLQRLGGLFGYFSLPPAVREHLGLRPAYSLHASPGGDHVAVLTREGLFVRSRESQFEGDDGEATWPLPAGADARLSEWHVAWAAGGEAIAVATATGDLHVVDRAGGLACSRPAPRGLAGVAFCGTAEVVCVTYDGKLYRLPVGRSDSQAGLPPVEASVLASAGGGVDAVVASVCADAARNALFVGGAQGGQPSLTRWRLAPGAPVTALPFRHSTAEELPAPDPAFAAAGEDGQSALHACCSLSVSPSGRSVAAADTGGRVIVWPADGNRPPAACGNVDSVTEVAWWGEEALSMAQRAGAVSINAVSDGANLLGNPEVFNPFSLICCGSGDPGDEQNRLLVLEGPDLEDVQTGGMGTLALCSLQQTTPEESYRAKLASKEYGSALSVAQYYGLDTDPVYKAQWLDVTVSSESNSDFLAKVKEPGWALEQCLHRVVNTGKEARCLLDYGMHLTHLARLQQYVQSVDSVDEADRPDEPITLTAEEVGLCVARAELVRHRNRLSTHIEAQRGYNKEVFLRFRDAGLVDEAMEFASRGDVKGVELLLTHHAREDSGTLLSQRLNILKQLPETVKPKSYSKLLPAVHEDKLVPLMLEQWHADDYVESKIAMRLWNPEGAAFTGVESQAGATVDEITAWYCKRALEIDERAGQLYVALELLREGKKKGVPGLEALTQTLTELIDVVERGTASVDMTVGVYESMSPDRRLACFIGDCGEEDIAEAVFSKSKGLLAANPGLLEEFLLAKAHDDFEISAAVFLYGARPQSKGELLKQRIFGDETVFIRAVLQCIYACQRTDVWDKLWQVWESVATRDKERARSDLMYRQLHCMVDELEGRLEAAQIMSTVYKMPYPTSFFAGADTPSTILEPLDSAADSRSTTQAMTSDFNFAFLPSAVELQILGTKQLRKAQDKVRLVCTRWKQHAAKIRSVHQVLRSLPRSVVSRKANETGSNAGLKMIQHAQHMHDIFGCVPYDDTLLYGLEGLLVKGYHTTAQQLLDGTLPACQGLRPIEALHDSDDPDTVDSQFAKRIGHVALAAARELINGCNDLRDSKADCQAASGCLSVVDHMRDHFSKGFLAEMEDEESFIEGIRGLSRFQLKSFKLPLQVRQCEDKMLIVQELLQSQPVYAEVEAVVALSKHLGLRAKDDDLRIQAEMARHAFEAGDMRIACDQTLSLISADHTEVWSLAHTIGKMWNTDSAEMKEVSGLTSSSNAQKLHSFAVRHCPAEALGKVLLDWRQCDEIVAKHSGEGLISQVEHMVEHTAEHLLTGIGDRLGLHKNALASDHADPAAGQTGQGVHPFYAARVSDAVAAKASCSLALRSKLPGSTASVESTTTWVKANICDLPLCMAVLMDMPEAHQVDAVLNGLVQGSVINSSLQCTLGLMCHSIALIGHTEGPAGVSSLLCSSVEDVAKTAEQRARQVHLQQSPDSELVYCANRVIHYAETAGDAELQMVLDVTRVEREKFFMDEEYRDNEIGRLITSGYETECARLLDFMDMPIWHMHSRQLLERMRSDSDGTAAEWMNDRESLLSDPVLMEELLRQHMLAHLRGTQHGKLAMCMDLLLDCCRLNGSQDCEAVERQLDSLRALLATPDSFRNGMDCGELVGVFDISNLSLTPARSREDVRVALGERVSSENVAAVADALDAKIQLHDGASVSTSLVYRACIERELRGCDHTGVNNKWHQLLKLLDHCDALDTLAVCQCDVANWPLVLCSRVLSDGLKLADGKLQKSKTSADDRSQARDVEASTSLASLRKRYQYLKGTLELAKSESDLLRQANQRSEGGQEWVELLQNSLDESEVRHCLVKMATLGCPQVFLSKAVENFLILTPLREITANAVDAEVGSIYKDAIDVSLSSFAACEVGLQRSALAAHLYTQFRAETEEDGEGTDHGDEQEASTALERLLSKTCKALVSAATLQIIHEHLVLRWCPAGMACALSTSASTCAQTAGLLALRVLSTANPGSLDAQHAPPLRYYVSVLLLEESVGWSLEPPSSDVEAVIAEASAESDGDVDAKLTLLQRLCEMQRQQGTDWAPALQACVVMVALLSETAGEESAKHKLWFVLLEAMVKYGDVEEWVERRVPVYSVRCLLTIPGLFTAYTCACALFTRRRPAAGPVADYRRLATRCEAGRSFVSEITTGGGTQPNLRCTGLAGLHLSSRG